MVDIELENILTKLTVDGIEGPAPLSASHCHNPTGGHYYYSANLIATAQRPIGLQVTVVVHVAPMLQCKRIRSIDIGSRTPLTTTQNYDQ